MGQWGEVKIIGGVKIIPHVKTDLGADIVPTNLIDSLYVLDISMSNRKWKEYLKKAKEKYVDKEYSLWIKENPTIKEIEMSDKLYPVIACSYRGLNYFESKAAAYKYYLSQGWHKQNIFQSLECGEIHIGLPSDIDPKMLMINREEGRYFEKFYT